MNDTRQFLTDLIGNYEGNVGGLPLNIGAVVKSGKINIQNNDQYLQITTRSWFNAELTNSVLMEELEKSIQDRLIVQNSDGTMGLSFIVIKEDGGLLGGLGTVIKPASKWKYQLKFKNDVLFSLRIQEFHTRSGNDCLHELIIRDVEKLSSSDSKEEKSEWDF